MSFESGNPADIEHLLWDEIERRQVGMLMPVGGPPAHAQPMTAFVERERRQLWFFSDAAAELARGLGAPRKAMFIWQQHDLQACIGGELSVQHDGGRMDHYWNAVVAAWHPRGRKDPHLTLLCLDCEDALVWVSTAGPIRTVWEIAKATATHRPPDVGVSAHLTFH